MYGEMAMTYWLEQGRHIFAAAPRRSVCYAAAPMPDLLAALDAFLQEHRRCGDLDGGLEDGRVWMACDCGADIVHPIEPPCREQLD